MNLVLTVVVAVLVYIILGVVTDFLQKHNLVSKFMYRIKYWQKKKTFTGTPLPKNYKLVVSILNKSQIPRPAAYVSYSLYCDPRNIDRFREKYFDTFIKQAQDIYADYKNFVIRVYIPLDFPQTFIDQLLENNIEVAMVNQKNNHSAAMAWRYLVADETVPWIINDADDVYDAKFFQKVMDEFLDSAGQYSHKKLLYSYVPLGIVTVLGKRMACRKRVPGIFSMIENLNKKCNMFACDELWLSQDLISLFTPDECLEVAYIGT